MKVAVIGSMGVGKSTLFDLLARGHEGKARGYISGVGLAEIEDPRIEKIREIAGSKSVKKPRIEIYDFDGFGKLWKEERVGEILNELLGLDLLLQIVGDFPPFEPESDFEEIDLRLILADLSIVENKLKRIEKEKMAHRATEEEAVFFRKLRDHLSAENVLSQLHLTEFEKNLIQGYSFLTVLPRVVIFNSSEERVEEDLPDSLIARLKERGYPHFRTILPIEREIRELEPEERDEILAGYGLKPGFVAKLKKAILEALGLITFFTTAHDELTAWLVREGTTAKEAAGHIHTDMERGFIRADVVHYDDLLGCGDFKKARETGHLRSEGKDYVVRDGDIIFIKFSR